MASKNQLLDMTPIGMIFKVLKSAADTDGKSLDLHWELLPKCNTVKPMIHIHPHAIETYEVLEGEMEFFIKDKWVAAGKGDKVTIPIGVAHTFRNPSDNVVTVFNTHQPALRMENYFEDLCNGVNKLSDNGKSVEMNLKAMLHLSVLMNKYRQEIISTNPPDAVIRTLGFIGKMLKIKIE